MTAPTHDLSPAARFTRQQAWLLAVRDARRAAWRTSGRNPTAFRRLMKAWLDTRPDLATRTTQVEGDLCTPSAASARLTG